MRDGTGIVPCVFFAKDCGEETFNNFDQITQETSLTVTGAVRKHPKQENVFEIGVQNFTIVGKSQDYPITPKEHGTDFLMDHRHLWIRSKRQHAILKIRHEITMAVRDFFDGRGFTLTDERV